MRRPFARVGIEEAARDELGIAAHLVDAVDRTRGHFGLDEKLQPLVARARAQHVLDLRDDLVARGAAVDVRRVARIGADLRLADRFPEALPDRVVAEPERDRVVLRLEHLVDGDHAVARAGALRALHPSPRYGTMRGAMKRVMLSIIEMSISWPRPVRLAVEERGERRVGRVHAGDEVGGRRADFLRRAVGLAGEIHDAAVAFGDQVVAREILARAFEPEAAERDDRRDRA